MLEKAPETPQRVNQQLSVPAVLEPVNFETNLISVTIVSEGREVIDYLRDFFSSGPNSPKGKNIFCLNNESGLPENIELDVNSHGVKYGVDPSSGSLYLQSSNSRDLAICARKAIRELHLQQCEKMAFTVLHGSAIYSDDKVVLFVGTNGAGKTTLALDGWLNHGFKLLANDHVVLMEKDGSPVITGLTTFFTLKLDHIRHVFDQLSQAVDLHYPTLEGYLRESNGNGKFPFYFGPQQFGVGEIPVFTLGAEGEKGLVIVAPNFQLGKPCNINQLSEIEIENHLAHEIRTEWVYDEAANPQFFGAKRRGASEFDQDSLLLCKLASKNCRAFSFQHSADLSELTKVW